MRKQAEWRLLGAVAGGPMCAFGSPLCGIPGAHRGRRPGRFGPPGRTGTAPTPFKASSPPRPGMPAMLLSTQQASRCRPWWWLCAGLGSRCGRAGCGGHRAWHSSTKATAARGAAPGAAKAAGTPCSTAGKGNSQPPTASRQAAPSVPHLRAGHQRLQRRRGVGAEQLLHRGRAAARRNVAQRAHERDEQAPPRQLILECLRQGRAGGSGSSGHVAAGAVAQGGGAGGGRIAWWSGRARHTPSCKRVPHSGAGKEEKEGD